MNAVPNMPLPADMPPAAPNSGASREGSLETVAEQAPADFKTTLQEINAQERSEHNGDAPLACEKLLAEGEDPPVVHTGGEPSLETAEAVAGAVSVAIDQDSQRRAIGLVGRRALPADNPAAIPSGENSRVASHLNPSGLPDDRHGQTGLASEARPSPAMAASLAAAPAADSKSAGPPVEPLPLARTTKPVNFRPSATGSKADSVQGRVSSVEMPTPVEHLPATPSTPRDDVQALKNGNPINTAVDNAREATTAPSAATIKATGAERNPTDALEGRIGSDVSPEGEEGLEVSGARPLPKDAPTAVHRLVQTARPDVEQRPEGLGGFERGAGAPLEKTAPAPPSEKPLPPTPDGFRDNNLASIVERVAVTVRGRQSEARIALKPEHLGSLRVQISTDNNMVSIKIMTEFPMARDLLESSLPQLKAELQQQGLEVEEFDVSFEDEKQPFRREERRARGGRPDSRLSGNVAEEELPASEETMREARRGTAERSSGIDYFA